MANWKFFLDGNEVEEPIGWDAIEFTAMRMESHGIDQPFSTEVRFYAEGARYIKAIYDQYFINQPIAIKIVSDVGFNQEDYEFNGFLNLAIYQEKNVCDTDSWEITVGIIDDEFREKFKARKQVEIDILENVDLDGNTITSADWEKITLHRGDVFLTARGRNLSPTDFFLEYNSDDLVPPYCWKFPDYLKIFPIYWDKSDFSGPYGSTLDVVGLDYTNTNAIFVNNTNITRTITFNISASGEWRPFDRGCGGTANWGALIRVQKKDGSSATEVALYSSPVFGNGTPFQPYSFSQTATMTIPPDYVVLVYATWGYSGTIRPDDCTNTVPFTCESSIVVNVEQLCIDIKELNSGEYASECFVLRVENYFKRIIQKLTGSNNKLLSDTFSKTGDGCFWNNAVTNGLRIRNAINIDQAEIGCGETPEENTSLFNTSWDIGFENLNKIFCLGWAFEWTGSEWKIRVEKADYFYQNLLSETFENVGEVTQSAKVDGLYNNIKIGYSDNWKNQNIGGAWAIMTLRNYFIGNKALNKNSTNTLELLSDFIAEGYAIEYSRRLQFYESGAVSSDRPNDYNQFIIWLNRNTISGSAVEDTRFNLEGETGAFSFSPGTVSYPSDYITLSNSPMEGLYNIYHTPARIACRWWKIVGTNCYGLTDQRLKFQTGEYQVSYSSTIDGTDEKEECIEIPNGNINESADIVGVNLKPEYQKYLFKPIEVSFSYPQSLCDFLTLSQDEQYKKVRLTSGSLVIEGFITQATNQPEDASGGTTNFTLLMSNLDSAVGGAFSAGFDDGYENG